MYDFVKFAEREVRYMKQSVKRILCGILIPCLMILCLLPPSSSLAASRTRYVFTENGKNLNVRNYPGKKGKVIARLPNGSVVSMVEDLGDWVEIELDDNTGYVMARFLTDKKPAEAESQWKNTSKTMYIKTGNRGKLHLRKEASRKSRSLGLYANGTEVRVSAVSTQWAKVIVSGKDGYMMLSCLTENREQGSAGSGSDQYVKGTQTIRMYTEPRSVSAVLTKLPGGTKVRVYAQTGKWSQVTAHGQQGYVLTSSLTSTVPAESTTKAKVINPNGASYVNLRSVPKMTGLDDVLAHIKVNTTVEVLGRKRSWMKIRCYGMVGYVYKTFLEIE